MTLNSSILRILIVSYCFVGASYIAAMTASNSATVTSTADTIVPTISSSPTCVLISEQSYGAASNEASAVGQPAPAGSVPQQSIPGADLQRIPNEWRKVPAVRGQRVLREQANVTVQVCNGGFLDDKMLMLSSDNMNNMNQAYFPINNQEIQCFVEDFCKPRFRGSYCVDMTALGLTGNCLPNVMIECPSGLVGICNDGTFCKDGQSTARYVKVQSGSIQQCMNVSDARCVPIFHLNTSTVGEGKFLAANVIAKNSDCTCNGNGGGNQSASSFGGNNQQKIVIEDLALGSSFYADNPLGTILPICQHTLYPCGPVTASVCTSTILVSPTCPCTIVTVTPTVTVVPFTSNINATTATGTDAGWPVTTVVVK